jgi:hypothetical protein
MKLIVSFAFVKNSNVPMKIILFFSVDGLAQLKIIMKMDMTSKTLQYFFSRQKNAKNGF